MKHQMYLVLVETHIYTWCDEVEKFSYVFWEKGISEKSYNDARRKAFNNMREFIQTPYYKKFRDNAGEDSVVINFFKEFKTLKEVMEYEKQFD